MTAEEVRQTTLDTFFRIADRFGVPCVILAVVLWFGHRASVALHGTVVEPMVRSHVEFLDTTAETLKEIGQVQRQQAETLNELVAGQRDLHEVVKTMRRE